jgi:hypothetical protein
MLFGLVALGCKDTHTRATGSSPVSFYPSELLPEMQSLLAALADIETCYEIACERLEQGSATEEEKHASRDALEAALRRDREPVVLRLARLQNRVSGSR